MEVLILSKNMALKIFLVVKEKYLTNGFFDGKVFKVIVK